MSGAANRFWGTNQAAERVDFVLAHVRLTCGEALETERCNFANDVLVGQWVDFVHLCMGGNVGPRTMGNVVEAMVGTTDTGKGAIERTRCSMRDTRSCGSIRGGAPHYDTRRAETRDDR
jgi:hypothetical protein